MFSNVSIIPNFVSVMSKTVKPSWSFPVKEAARIVASFTFTTTRKSIPTFYVKEMNLSGVVVRENLTVGKILL